MCDLSFKLQPLRCRPRTTKKNGLLRRARAPQAGGLDGGTKRKAARSNCGQVGANGNRKKLRPDQRKNGTTTKIMHPLASAASMSVLACPRSCVSNDSSVEFACKVLICHNPKSCCKKSTVTKQRNKHTNKQQRTQQQQQQQQQQHQQQQQQHTLKNP